jgi:hypothetical protein
MQSSATKRMQERRSMPDNAVYYHLAYIAACLIYVGYSLRLAMKRNNLKTRRSRSS